MAEAATASTIPPTLYAALSALTAAEPDKTLFIEPSQDGYRKVSRREFLDSVNVLRDGLRQRGVGHGQCIATWLPNWSGAYAWQFAASAVGAHVIGINTRYNVAEVAHVLTRAKPVILAMAHNFQRLDLLGRAKVAVADADIERIPMTAPVPAPGCAMSQNPEEYDLGGGVWDLQPSGIAPVDNVGDADGHQTLPDLKDGEVLSVAFTTSGSTGMPKLAAHSESGVIGHAVADADRIGFVADDVLIGALPFSGVFGFSASMAAIFGGASILLHPVFAEQELVRAMARFRATHFVGADDMVSRIAKAWDEAKSMNPENADLTSWKWMGIADFQGQSRDLAAWAAREFGTDTVGVYGSSELFALTAFWAPDTDEDRRWGGGGYPASPAIKVRIADPFTEEVLDPADEGELQFSGPNVVNAYLGDTGERAGAFTADGWFRSGDLGTISDDGGFVYLCRIGDVLRLKGFLVHPSEIEYRLAGHPSVETAKVVGLKTPTGETQAIGFVTLAPAAERVSEWQLQDWCKEALARFKVPSAIHIVDKMPTTAGTNGTKIRAATLREWAKDRNGLGPDPTDEDSSTKTGGTAPNTGQQTPARPSNISSTSELENAK